MKKLSLFFISLTIVLIVIELFLRLGGFEVYQLPKLNFKSNPEGCIGKDSLGFHLVPGSFRVLVSDSLEYFVTHGFDSLRVTSYHADSDTPKPKIFIFGCSYTYGQGVNDNETFPFLLQDAFPEYNIFNYAVPGQGTHQAFLRFRQALENGNFPDLVIVSYATFHEERNFLSRSYQHKLYQGCEVYNEDTLIYPFVELIEDTFVIKYGNVLDKFKPTPFRQVSVLANFIDESLSEVHSNQRKQLMASQTIVSAMHELCLQHGILFVIADVESSHQSKIISKFCQEKPIEYIDISPDFSAGIYRNLPYDFHPNALAQQYYADRLTEYLEHLTKN